MCRITMFIWQMVNLSAVEGKSFYVIAFCSLATMGSAGRPMTVLWELAAPNISAINALLSSVSSESARVTIPSD